VTDISETAIEKAGKLSSSVKFKRNDILNSTLGDNFDYIFDRGSIWPKLFLVEKE